jgi:ankyrin repeat protein
MHHPTPTPTTLTSTSKESAKHHIQLLLNAAVAAVTPTPLRSEYHRIATSGRSSVVPHQGIQNGGDFMSRCSVALYRRFCHTARSHQSPDVRIDPTTHHLEITTRSDVLGLTTRSRYASPADIARHLVDTMPTDKVSAFLADIRIREHCLVFTTHRHMLVQRKRNLLPCTTCGLFYKGERGIRDHMLVKHRFTYEQSKSAATESRRALVPYWRTGTETDAHWIASLEEEAQLLSAASNQLKHRALPPGVEAARDGNVVLLTQLYQDKQFNPNKDQDRHGSTALMWACGNGHLKTCQYLVQTCGMDPSSSQSKHRSKRTPLHWSARNGHLHVCQWLVNDCHVHPDARTADGTSAFHYAVMFGQLPVCRWLHTLNTNIAHGINSYGCNAVQWGALSGSIAMCEALLQEFHLDFTLLNHNGHSVFHKAAVKGHFNVCCWLLKVGRSGMFDPSSDGEGEGEGGGGGGGGGGFVLASLFQKDKGGCAPSEMARLEGHVELAEMLLVVEQEGESGGKQKQSACPGTGDT